MILGTAGHIDHGKTALVEALTGTDTDRLQEEKARGITIELGFAELELDDGSAFGVVDVPGHEAFVRAMVAGAAGMDVVLLVVAAEEGIMPQTREHLAIVELLGVPQLVVALTKCDLVEEEWLELVEAEVGETLASTPYRGATMVRTSATEGTGLEELKAALREAGGRSRSSDVADLTRLPLDRVFTIRGTGTVVTGTLWSGSLGVDDRVRILPQGLDARVRSLQVHGRDAGRATAGARTAVALTGDGADRELIGRGSTLVTDAEWSASRMLTAWVRMVADTEWMLEHNQRVHVHLGTADVRARVALLQDAPLGPGEEGWVQLRLEEPMVARGRDRIVIRAYSPVTTIGGGVVAESHPPKRTRLTEGEREALHQMADGTSPERLAASLELAGWEGVKRSHLPIRTGLAPEEVETVLASMGEDQSVVAGSGLFGSTVGAEARERILRAVDAGHAADPLLAAVPLAAARAGLPAWAPTELADAVIERLVKGGALEAFGGGVRRVGHEARLTPEQERVSERILALLADGGLAPPLLDELPAEITNRGDFLPLLRTLEEAGSVRQVSETLYVSTDELDAAEARIRSTLGGRTGLGPADFRDALPVTRKHLIPLLNHFDGRGITLRTGEGRDVPEG
ncbi:MAG: selenocysteine-specific translation elongation factor [Longimicrobiales bacterium]|nr:selenocysteine-specific translation elongation factor [Longimicrobiales bacterium]